MEQHEYLSPGWLEAVRAVRADYASHHEALDPLIVNYTITDVPGHDGDAHFHSDARSPLYYEPGHHADAAWAVSTDWATAREIYQDTSWGLDRMSAAYEDGTLVIVGDAEAIRQAWADAIRARDYMEVLDRIAAFTA
jgi:hypothetical protein